MIRRTTIELDDDLLERARRALGVKTARATVEEALRRVTEESQSSTERRARDQGAYLENLARHVDLDVMSSEEMWT